MHHGILLPGRPVELTNTKQQPTRRPSDRSFGLHIIPYNLNFMGWEIGAACPFNYVCSLRRFIGMGWLLCNLLLGHPHLWTKGRTASQRPQSGLVGALRTRFPLPRTRIFISNLKTEFGDQHPISTNETVHETFQVVAAFVDL